MGKMTLAELLLGTLVSREVSRIYGVAKIAEAAELLGLTADRPEQVQPMIARPSRTMAPPWSRWP